MRVIAGKFKSRRLEAPAGIHTRPTSDRLRETLFNVVAPRIHDSVWLDLFAGSGAIGIEALSRGARSVYFVESAAAAARTIRKNLHTLAIEDGFEVIERGERVSEIGPGPHSAGVVGKRAAVAPHGIEMPFHPSKHHAARTAQLGVSWIAGDGVAQ